MHVYVKLFASLAQYSPSGKSGTSFETTLSESATMQDLVGHLGIPPEEIKISFVNGVIQSMDWVLKQGDEVGIFPPIGGG